MTKKPLDRNAARDQKRAVDWKYIVASIVAAAVILFVKSMDLSLNQQDSSGPVAQAGLIAYCEENPETCVFEGSETAPVTLLEVLDFACLHCRNFNLEELPVFKNQYKDSGQVRFVTYPFASRPDTSPAINASLCANKQEAFAEYTSALFRQFGEPAISEAHLLDTAVSVNLDHDQFATCLEEGRYHLIISENVSYAHSLGVTSAPNFFINDTQVTSNQPQLIQQIIEAALVIS